MWTWLAACEEPGRGVEDAEPVACLGVPVGAELPADGVFEGRAASDSSETVVDWTLGDRCDERSRVLGVQAPEGTWFLGYGWSEGGYDATAPMDLGPGRELSVTFVVDGTASGFVVREGASRIVAALENGLGGPALAPGEIPTFSVRNGTSAGSESDACGRLRSRRMVFVGEEEVTLEPVSSDFLGVDGQSLQVWALANTALRDETCPILGRKAWALWRRP